MADGTQDKQGTDALDVSIKGLRTARKKLETAIAIKKVKSQDYKPEMREKARVSRKLPILRQRKALMAAGRVVVAAPKVADIRAVRQLIASVERQAVAGAAWRQGINLVQQLITDSATLGDKVKI